MDQINEQLDRLTELSDDELGALEGNILSEFDALEQGDVTQESVRGMTRMADALDSVRGEITTRSAAAEELFAAKEAAASRIGAHRQVGEEQRPVEPTDASPIGDDNPDLEDVADGGADEVAEGDAPPPPPMPGDDPEDVADGGADDATEADAPPVPATPDNPDPDGDGDDDTTPEGDTDNSHFDENGNPKTAVSAAAVPGETFKSAEKKEGSKPPARVDPTTTDGHDSTDPGKLGEKTVSKRGKANGGAKETALDEPEAAEASVDEPQVAEEEEAPVQEAAVAEETSEETGSSDENEAADEASVSETPTQEEEHPVTASGAEPEITPPADRLPAPTIPAIAEVPVVITAGADIPGVPAGNELPDMIAVANGMVQRMHSMRRTSGGDGEQHIVASLQAQFPEDRTLRTTQQELNGEKIRKVTSPEALVAAGGLCAPVNVRYDLFGLGGNARPVKDALAPFAADRGGIRFITPPKLTDLANSVALWTVQDDIDASTVGAPDPVKPCLRVVCGTETVVLLEAITLCLTFGNLGARAYPEMVARNNELALIQHSRFAETRLLTRIGTLSTSVSAAHIIGAARDFLVHVETAAAGYRNRHRMDAGDPLRVIAPIWLKNMIRADLTMQLPGDGPNDTLGVADSLIESWFSLRGINISWSLDGETGQYFGTQTGGTGTLPNRGGNVSGFDSSSNVVADTATYTGVQALNGFPSTVVWYLFAEGSFLFLDGGTLDLGLVRDSTLNGTNDYKMFIETFEGVAFVGVESLRVLSTLKVSGATSGTVSYN